MLDLAQDWRDARACRETNVVQPFSFAQQKSALGRHDLQRGPFLEHVVCMRGKTALRHLLDAHPPGPFSR